MNKSWSYKLARSVHVVFITMASLIVIALCVCFILMTSNKGNVMAAVGISSHVLDQTKGAPASGIHIDLYLYEDATKNFKLLSNKVTDSDGRVDSFIDHSQFVVGTYKAVFNVGHYFEASGLPHFYPRIEITFLIGNNTEHYHVPVLLSPFGFSTYRGS